jgi:hypothetical protein
MVGAAGLVLIFMGFLGVAEASAALIVGFVLLIVGMGTVWAGD